MFVLDTFMFSFEMKWKYFECYLQYWISVGSLNQRLHMYELYNHVFFLQKGKENFRVLRFCWTNKFGKHSKLLLPSWLFDYGNWDFIFELVIWLVESVSEVGVHVHLQRMKHTLTPQLIFRLIRLRSFSAIVYKTGAL